MVVYNTATAGDVIPGFYFNNGTRWVPSLPKANSAGEMQYWDGIKWLTIPSGQPGPLVLTFSNSQHQKEWIRQQISLIQNNNRSYSNILIHDPGIWVMDFFILQTEV
ncbi:MAG TPA: hypothetical protein VIK07_06390 [Bacteroidales bacterium]